MRFRPPFASAGLAGALSSLLAAAALVVAQSPAAPDLRFPPAADLERLEAYIEKTWDTLTRSLKDLPAAVPDSKVPLPPGAPHPLYVAASEDVAAVTARIHAALTPEQRRSIEVRTLVPGRTPEPHGLLYLPEPYVVPGGRFNEMYGWDSYFIQVGLLEDGRIDLARAMADNFRYEIEQYGTVLNANRTYFLTRSQPPFFTRMLLGVYERTNDRSWLARALPAVEQYYAFWMRDPHLVGKTGLSRYFDTGDGPAPEVEHGERDAAGKSHYDRVREYYRTHEVDAYDESRYYDAKADALTPLFYKGDRSMRESGFDPSNRFGPFGVDIIHYVPVCLNVLLYQTELDAAEMASILGHGEAARRWRERAAARAGRINDLLWDGDAGLYFDYNFETGRRRRYPFATTFYPLWAGIASREQAARVRANLPRFEAAGGLLTSTEVTGSQWDAPFGWAPLQLIAVEGLRRYGYHEDADRLARKFIALVSRELAEHGKIVEKYDVVRADSDLRAGLKFGYTSNEAGFGWTNGTVRRLLTQTKNEKRKMKDEK